MGIGAWPVENSLSGRFKIAGFLRPKGSLIQNALLCISLWKSFGLEEMKEYPAFPWLHPMVRLRDSIGCSVPDCSSSNCDSSGPDAKPFKDSRFAFGPAALQFWAVLESDLQTERTDLPPIRDSSNGYGGRQAFLKDKSASLWFIQMLDPIRIWSGPNFVSTVVPGTWDQISSENQPN